jgi:curved DNA-binding protein CbpA
MRKDGEVMAAAGRGGMAPDHYQLLGVDRGASREEIAQAWRRRARAEHPDRRPGEAGEAAAGRFQALAEAWHVLADPARRAAYDRALEGEQPAPRTTAPAAQVPVRHLGGPARPAGPLARSPVPPLRAGPVRVEGPCPAPAGPDEREARPAVLAELILRYLAAGRDWPW